MCIREESLPAVFKLEDLKIDLRKCYSLDSHWESQSDRLLIRDSSESESEEEKKNVLMDMGVLQERSATAPVWSLDACVYVTCAS